MSQSIPQDTLSVGRTNEAMRIGWLQKTLAAIPAGSRILDAGAGEQQFRPLCQHLKYVSQDFAQYVPAEDPTGLQMPKWDYGKLDHVCDITAVPERDGVFDAILCTEVFEHIANPLAALKEFSRLLRPGGVAIITAPFASLVHFAPHHYASGFSRYWYETHLPAFGFRIDDLAANGNWFEFLAQELRRTHLISTRYGGISPAVEEKEAMKRVLGFLQKCTAADAGSSEVLCFGYHVRATRL